MKHAPEKELYDQHIDTLRIRMEKNIENLEIQRNKARYELARIDIEIQLNKRMMSELKNMEWEFENKKDV